MTCPICKKYFEKKPIQDLFCSEFCWKRWFDLPDNERVRVSREALALEKKWGQEDILCG